MAISSAATEAEFELMLADVGVPVVFGAVSTNGVLDYDDQLELGESGFQSSMGAGSQKRGQVIGRQLILTVLTSDFADEPLESDESITVDGVEYEIIYAQAHSHMALNLTAVYLRKA